MCARARSPVRRRDRNATMDEKDSPPTRRFNAVGFCLTGIRIWQWSSSFFVWGSFSLLYDHIQRNRLGENGRMKLVEHLVRPPCLCLSLYTVISARPPMTASLLTRPPRSGNAGPRVPSILDSRDMLHPHLQDPRPAVMARLRHRLAPRRPDHNGHLPGQDHHPVLFRPPRRLPWSDEGQL